MFHSSAQAACRLTTRRRLALGGLAVSTALVAGAFVSTPAFADGPDVVNTYDGLQAALASHESSIQLGADLDSGDSSGTQYLEIGASTTLDLAGHTLSTYETSIDDGATFAVTDSTSTDGVVGSGQLNVSSDGVHDTTAVDLGDGSTFHVTGANVYASGTDDGAGIGSDYGTDASFIADGNASVEADADYNSSAAGGAGIGGWAGASGISVTIDNADVRAHGGTGAAGIGGGEHHDGGDVTLLNGATTDAEQGNADGLATASASSFGPGQDAAGFGSLFIGQNTAVNFQSDTVLRLPATATVENHGTIELVQPDGFSNAAVTGAGTIHNLGSIRGTVEDAQGDGTTVDPTTLLDPAISVTGNNYQVSVDANGGAYTGTESGHVLSASLEDVIGSAYSDYQLTEPDGYSFSTWNTAANGSGTDVADDLSVAGASTGTPKAITLFAKYVRVPYATGTLPAGKVSTPYDAALPVAGDGLSGYSVFVSTDPANPVPGLPAGLSMNATTGRITGTPTEAVDRDITVDVQGAAENFVTYHLTIAPAAVAPPVVVAPSAPVLSTVALRTVKLGQVLSLPLGVTGDLPITFKVAYGSLPKGIALDGRTGVISGAPTASGTYTAFIEATNSAGSVSTPVTIVVPEVRDLISTNNAVPAVKVGAATVPLHVAGLKKGEHWTVKVDGKLVEHGTMKHAGALSVAVHLKKALKDKVHTITITGSRTVTDRSTRAATTVTVTSLAARKTLKVQTVSANGMKLIAVEKLAAGEQVVIRDKGKVIAKGHANAYGIFTFAQSKAGKGTSKLTVTGAAVKRAGKLTVKNPKH